MHLESDAFVQYRLQNEHKRLSLMLECCLWIDVALSERAWCKSCPFSGDEFP